MRNLVVLLILFVTLDLSPLAYGATADNAIAFHWYSTKPPLSLTGPQGQDDITLNRGNLYRFTYLHRFDRVGVEAGISSLSSSTKPSYDLGNGVRADYRFKYSEVRLPVAVKYFFHPGGFDLYAGLGTGLYRAELKARVATSAGYVYADSGTSIGPEFRIVFGGDFRFTEHCAIGVEIGRCWCRYDFGEFIGDSQTVSYGNPTLFIQYQF
ncbi:MAG: outer membrane beta-barrel protein [Syntrophaceae bacterium]